MSIESKLPHVGTTIFTIMSKLAAEQGALNLSQGFPGFDCSPELIQLAEKYLRTGHNQYAPMTGALPLREALAQKTKRMYGKGYDPEAEITITSGATEALFAAATAVIQRGDEVLVFEPAYDSYLPAIELNGGIPVYITLEAPAFAIDWERVRTKITDRTRLIFVNTPHNPTGYVWTQADIQTLADLVAERNLFIIADEVYEHITFDNREHVSLATHPILRERTFVCSSFGKTFHVTGWKVGYCLAPVALSAEFRKIHQYLTFSTVTPIQYALADYLTKSEHYESVSGFYQRKRNHFLSHLEGFAFTPAQGTFFQNLSFDGLSEEGDNDLAVRLTKEIKVASIPLSVFYHKKNDPQLLRFCFAKEDEMLARAAERLSEWAYRIRR
ncbi:MAG: methionine aminotransferase [Siphonobacter sp.]